MLQKRVYVCHTFYHVYITLLKELNLPANERGHADLILSKMSNDFGTLSRRVKESQLFHNVFEFDEKEASYFPKLNKFHKDYKNLFVNMFSRMCFTKLFGKYQEPFIPVDLKKYQDIYVFCDSDPIGYYLNYKRIPYHALEDGLDCISAYDTARYDNRGHFEIKAWLAARNFIFIQNGYSKYCIDMEVNNIACLPFPCKKYIEKSRKDLSDSLSETDKLLLVSIFLKNADRIVEQIKRCDTSKETVMILTEPLCDLKTRKQIFCDIIDQYGKNANILIKPHPRDKLNYKEQFLDCIVIEGMFPMEILNSFPKLHVNRIVSVFTKLDAIEFSDEKIFLGEDFMDKYESPEIHRQNEQIF